jgi:CBS domain-containing protein
MNPNVITVARNENIYEAVRIMILNGITGLPVVNADGTLAGIITEKDVLQLLLETQDTPHVVEDYMTTDVVCFDQDEDLTRIVECFLTHPFRRVLILDKERLAGIVSTKDIIRHIVDLKQENELVAQDATLEILY